MDLEITKTPLIVLSKEGQATIQVPSASNGSLLLENGNRLALESGGVLLIEDDGTVTQAGIASGTLNLKRSIVDTDIDFGTPIASEFSVELFNIDTDLQGYTIQVYLKDTQAGTLTPIFTGIVDSSKTDNVGHTRQIVAYDWIYYHRNDNVADWWNALPRTIRDIKTVRNSLLTYLGFTVPSASYVNDYAGGLSWTSETFPIMTTITFNQVIKMLCELQGTFPYIDATGNLTFATLDNGTTTDLRGEYESYNSTWEDFVTEPITGIASYSSSDDLLMMVGTDDNVYNIAGNLWFIYLIEEFQSAAQEVLEDLLDAIDGIQYKPCQLKMIKAHNGLVLGQRVQTDKGYSYVMSEELSGVCFVEQTIEAKASASKLSGEVNDINDTMVQGHKISRVEKTIDGISTQVSNTQTNLQNNYYTKRATESRLQQTSTEIVTYVGETVTAEVRSEVSSQIQQVADKIVLKVDNNGKIVKAALSADPSTGSTFSIDADYISFVANKTIDLVTGNIAVSANNFSIDNRGNVTLTGTIHANRGDIGGWTIKSDGLSYGMTAANDYTHTGMYIHSGGSVVLNNTSLQSHLSLDTTGIDIYDNRYSANRIASWDLNYTSSQGAYGTSIQLHAYDASASALAPIYTTIANDSYTLYAYDNNTGNRGIDFKRFWDTNCERDKVIYNDTYNGLQTCNVTKTEVEYLSGVTSNIQTQLDSKISAANGAISTVVNSNLTASRALISNANGKIAVSSITSTKLGYLTDVTSNIQSQIDGKQATITGAATTITSSNLTTSRALISNSSGKVAVSSVTSTELGYLSGVTSNIQTQLDSKISSANGAISTVVNSNLTTSRALISNTSGKIAVSATTSTELGYLSGVTSNVQTQLNGKQSTISGGATTITSSNLTTNRALVSNSSGKVAVSTTTSTELGYVHGVTSNIQTQLDAKAQIANSACYSGLRFKNLGTSLTSAQATAIANGDFSDLWNGDYWEHPTYGWRFYIVDNTQFAKNRVNGVEGFTKPHLIVMPLVSIYEAGIHNSGTTSTGYGGCYYRTNYRATCKSAFTAIFGSSHIATYKDSLTNSTAGRAWYECDVEIPQFTNIFGFSPVVSSSNIYNLGVTQGRFRLFELAPYLIHNTQGMWVRDINDANAWGCIYSSSMVSWRSPNNSTDSSGNVGMKPFAIII